jgi:hypothetical protein
MQFLSFALRNDQSAQAEQTLQPHTSEATSMKSLTTPRFRFQGSSQLLLALAASTALFTAGCANMATTAPGANSFNSAASLSGRIHGGNQPVSGATVTLWYAGLGPSSPAVMAATTTSANDGAGSFTFIRNATAGQPPNGNIFSCPVVPAPPSSYDPLVYVVATGGNTLNNGDPTVNNSASVFIAPYGPCSTLQGSTVVEMTEVTTVATMAALQQWYDPATGIISTSGTGLATTALTNAFTTVSNLVDLPTGTAPISKTIPAGSITAGVGYTGTSVTATPEAAKINHLANILSSCINNASASAANCVTLFNNATPPAPSTTAHPGSTFATATDVLHALYYMLTNPTNGSTTHLNNLYNLSPAVGAPFQPTLTTVPTDWTIGINYASSSTCGANGGHLINSAADLAIDSYGAIWLANNEPGKGNLTQLSSNGIPVTCIAVGSGAYTGVTVDTLLPLNNIWVADAGSSNVYRYKPRTPTILAFPTTSPASAILADGTGNVYYTSPTEGKLFEFPGAANSGTIVTALPIATGIGPTPIHAMMDSTPAIWTTSGSNFITRTISATPDTGAGFTSTQISTDTPSYGLSTSAYVGVSGLNYVYVGAQGSSNSLSVLHGSGTSYSSASGWPVTTLSTPAAVASDGAQNVWTINNAPGANSVVELSVAAQPLSPVTGFQKDASYLGSGRSLVIDSSGNLWIGLDGANSITEIVGAAVPVSQPYSGALNPTNLGFQTIP